MSSHVSSGTAPYPGPAYIGDLGRSGLDLRRWHAGSPFADQDDAADFARSWTDGSLGLFVHEISARDLQITAVATDDLIAVAIPLEAQPDRTLTVEQISTSERPHFIEFIALPRHSSISIVGLDKGMKSITLLVRAADFPELFGSDHDLPEMIARLARDHSSMIRSHAFPCSVERVAREIWEAARDGRFSPLFCRYKSAELLNALFEYWMFEDEHSDDSPCSDRERIGVLKVRELIETDPVNLRSIDELARLAGMNRTKLRSLFKRLCGTTMVNFRTDMMMRTADAMLRESDLPVAEISFQLGYSEPSSFNTAYRRFFGHPPGRARRP